jgi:glycosyltransferase involved in cell wall biosynthesis
MIPMAKSLRVALPWYRFPPFHKTIGGLSVWIWEMSQNLVKQGVELEVLVPPGLALNRNARECEAIKLIALDREVQDLSLFRDYDYVVSVNNFGSKAISKTRKLTKVVRVLHTAAHDRALDTYVSMNANPIEYAKCFFLREREKRAEERLSGVLTACVSRYLKGRVLEHGLERAENLVYTPNCVDTTLFYKKEQEKRFDIAFVGRFQKVKGLDILLKALRKLDFRPNVNIVGIEDPRERRWCLQVVKNSATLTFSGFVGRNQMPEVYRSAKILVVASRYETFGLPVLEAMACGTPVVATAVGGVLELVQKEWGILVPPGDPAALAHAIKNALNNQRLFEGAQELAPEKATEFDSKSVAKLFKEKVFI